MLKFPNITEIRGFSQWEGVSAPTLCSPIQLIHTIYWAPPYIFKCAPHTTAVNTPPPPPPYILKCAPHPPPVNPPPPPPHQWVSPSCPIIFTRLSCTKSLPCPFRNKLFAILYKIIGKLPLSTCFTSLTVGTQCFAH